MVQATHITADTPWLGNAGRLLDGLLPALERLDRRLECAMVAAQETYGPATLSDPFRGLHISPDEITRLLDRAPGGSPLRAEDTLVEPFPAPADDMQPLAWLGQTFGLAPFDLDILLIALAPEIDLRYERLYAYLQDDVARRRPTVDLALNLLCASAAARIARRGHFAPTAPLISHGLLHVVADPSQIQPPLLSHYLKPDEQIVDLLLGQAGLDRRLTPFCQLIEPVGTLDELPVSADTGALLRTLADRAGAADRPLRLYFHSARGVGTRRAAEALANQIGAPLLAADLDRAQATGLDFAQALRRLFRAAWLQGALLYIGGLDQLRDGRASDYQHLIEALTAARGVVIIAGEQPWVPVATHHPLGLISVCFAMPNIAQRQACWSSCLEQAGIMVDPDQLEGLAARFRLTPGQIGEAVLSVSGQPLRRAAPAEQVLHSLFVAARTQSGHGLAALAHKITPLYTWGDLVLPNDALAQLHEICARIVNRVRVLGTWGFDGKLSHGKGVNALFAGPSGTGKTMAAEIIAGELELDLYKIDLAGVVSKYIGETEKNLDRVFSAAESANAILFFDEADALFGKRSEVHDSHDRYANIESAYLLQKMEQFDGIAILATNLRGNLDEAFTRRLAFTIHFPFPDDASRRRIWAGIWPATAPVADDVDLDFLARQFKLSGGNIKNIALAAAFLAAGTSGRVTMAHLLHATRREYQKMGRLLADDELGVYAPEVAA